MSGHATTGFEPERIAAFDGPGVIRIPQLVKGRLLLPPPMNAAVLERAGRTAGESSKAPLAFRAHGAQVLRLPELDAGSQTAARRWRYLITAPLDPSALIETDTDALSRELHALPFEEVLRFAGALRDVLCARRRELAAAVRRIDGGTLLDEPMGALLFDLLPLLLEPDALGEALDRELGSDGIPGRRFLDGWVELSATAHRGMMARVADGLFARAPAADGFRCRQRAVPTRQLHVTAGNSPLVPVLSWLRGLLTKGACVVKAPADAAGICTLLGAALRAVDAHHPIVRHTSFVYWPGGDEQFESALLAPGAFDRLVIWGAASTVESLRRRALHCKTVVLGPRYGLSLIGHDSFPEDIEEAAQRASVDSLVWDQQACTASLVHYVEGDEATVGSYCRALQAALARWDERLPRPVPRASLGRLRLLRRGPLLNATWFVNGSPAEPRSAVVYSRGPFDLSLHPQTRFVLVRRVDRLEEVIPSLGGSVSTVGIHPPSALRELRDRLAAAGVGNVWPLGESERAFPGMPHDGMRVMSELVAWTSSGELGEAHPQEA